MVTYFQTHKLLNPNTHTLTHSHSYTPSTHTLIHSPLLKSLIHIIFKEHNLYRFNYFSKLTYLILMINDVIPLAKVLVAYDCSAEANKALERALSIANPDDEIIILTVIPDAETVFCSDENNKISSNNIPAKLDDLKSKLSSSNLTISTRIIHGEIVPEILRASEDPEVRLIVLGFKGISRIGNFKLGSVSGQVAKLAKKPILVVK